MKKYWLFVLAAFYPAIALADFVGQDLPSVEINLQALDELERPKQKRRSAAARLQDMEIRRLLEGKGTLNITAESKASSSVGAVSETVQSVKSINSIKENEIKKALTNTNKEQVFEAAVDQPVEPVRMPTATLPPLPPKPAAVPPAPVKKATTIESSETHQEKLPQPQATTSSNAVAKSAASAPVKPVVTRNIPAPQIQQQEEPTNEADLAPAAPPTPNLPQLPKAQIAKPESVNEPARLEPAKQTQANTHQNAAPIPTMPEVTAQPEQPKPVAAAPALPAPLPKPELQKVAAPQLPNVDESNNLPPLPDIKTDKTQAPATPPAQAKLAPVPALPKVQEDAPALPQLPEASPAPTPPQQREQAKAPPAAQAPAAGDTTQPGVTLSIPFVETETELPISVQGQLQQLIAKIKPMADVKINIIAYASGSEEQASASRRISLSRALAVRTYLVDNGIDKARIFVQSKGNKSNGGNPDRVDLIAIKGN